MVFELDIQSARRGWIILQLNFQHELFLLQVSGVANDPMEELAAMAEGLAVGSPYPIKTWLWLEPSGYELSVSRREDDTWLQLRYAEDGFARMWEPSRLLGEVPVDGHALARKICRALERARDELVAANARKFTENMSDWYYPFPAERLARARTALRSAR